MSAFKIGAIILMLIIPTYTRNSFSRETTRKRIKYVALIFRHGDRNPIGTYPKDPYKNYNWPRGWGQLRNEGIKRLHKNGQYFASRYNALTRKYYEPFIQKMESSHLDRCLMSGESLYSGYFIPLKGPDLWDKFIHWVPIPVYMKSAEDDNILAMSKPCSRYDQLTEKYYKTNKNIKNECLRDKKVYEYIKRKTGMNLSHCGTEMSFVQLYLIFDTLLVQRANKLKLPSWSKKVFPEPLKSIIGKNFLIQLDDPKINKYKAGPLLNIILTDMINATQASSETTILKEHLFSAHDSTVISILRAFRNYNNIPIPYGATVMIELSEELRNYYVSVLYKNETDEKPYPLDLPECPTPCTLDKFHKSISSLLPKDWEAECKVQNTSNIIHTIINATNQNVINVIDPIWKELTLLKGILTPYSTF